MDDARSNTAVLALATFPDVDTAAAVARTLVEERLVACVNIVPGARSIYAWQGELCDDAEVVGLLKSTRDRLDALRDRFIELHPYDVPELIAVPIEGGNADYLAWVAASVR